jgi:acyl carrier protein
MEGLSTPAAKVRAAILEALAGPLAAIGMDTADVPDEMDILLEGLVDSLGLVTLLAELEDRFDLQLDYDDLPIEDLTKIGRLSHHVARQSAVRG